MAESKIQDTNYYQVTGWMLNRLGLKGTALQVYAIIYGFSQDGESCFSGSLQYLCDFTGASRSTVIRVLKDLTEQGFVLKTENVLNGVQLNTYKAVCQNDTPGVKMTRGECQNDTGGGVKMTRGGGVKMTPNNKDIDNKKDNKEDKKEACPLPEHIGSDLQAAFADWLTYKAERKEGYTPTGRKSLETEVLNNAKKYGEAAVVALIRKCMASGWKGIIFEKLQNQPKQYGKKEIVPSWMQNDGNDFQKQFERNKRSLEKSAETDPELKARVERLKQRIGGGGYGQ